MANSGQVPPLRRPCDPARRSAGRRASGRPETTLPVSGAVIALAATASTVYVSAQDPPGRRPPLRRGGRGEIDIDDGPAAARTSTSTAESQPHGVGQRVKPGPEPQGKFLVVAVPGAAAEDARVPAAEIIAGVHGCSRPRAAPVPLRQVLPGAAAWRRFQLADHTASGRAPGDSTPAAISRSVPPPGDQRPGSLSMTSLRGRTRARRRRHPARRPRRSQASRLRTRPPRPGAPSELSLSFRCVAPGSLKEEGRVLFQPH